MHDLNSSILANERIAINNIAISCTIVSFHIFNFTKTPPWPVPSSAFPVACEKKLGL